jgi:hypothetical protein
MLGSLTELTVRSARVCSISPKYANTISAVMVRSIQPHLNVFDRIKSLPGPLVQEAGNVDVKVSTNLGVRYPWGLLGPWSKLLWSAVKLDIHGFHQSKLNLYQNSYLVQSSGQLLVRCVPATQAHRRMTFERSSKGDDFAMPNYTSCRRGYDRSLGAQNGVQKTALRRRINVLHWAHHFRRSMERLN